MEVERQENHLNKILFHNIRCLNMLFNKDSLIGITFLYINTTVSSLYKGVWD